MFTRWGLDRPEILCHDFDGATALQAYYLNDLRYSHVTIFDPVAVAPWQGEVGQSAFYRQIAQMDQKYTVR